jgi:hypothetical protein
MTTATENLELILFGWLDAMHRRDPTRIAPRLADGVIWQGLRPELVCRNREDVIDNIRSGGEQRDRVRGVEVDAPDDEHVLLRVRIPGLEDLFGTPVAGEVYELFTIRDGVIVRIDESATRPDLSQS